MKEQLKEFVEMAKLKRDLEAELESVMKRMAELEQPLMESFAEQGIQNINIDGETVYLHSQIWAKVADGATKDDVLVGLKAAGLGDYVNETYNSNQVSALLREWADQQLPIPEPLVGKLEANEKFSLRVRKATAPVRRAA